MDIFYEVQGQRLCPAHWTAWARTHGTRAGTKRVSTLHP